MAIVFRQTELGINESNEYWTPRYIRFEVPFSEACGTVDQNDAGKNTLPNMLTGITNAYQKQHLSQ